LKSCSLSLKGTVLGGDCFGRELFWEGTVLGGGLFLGTAFKNQNEYGDRNGNKI
jgi:hypothetical protein